MGIEGRWYNELGSEMNLSVDAEGRIVGRYQTAVAERPLPPVRPLVGLCDVRPKGDRPQSIAFTVNWGHADSAVGSITAWSGQYRMLGKHGDEEVLVMTWLLTTETEQRDAWSSTLVGQDLFTRSPPDAMAVARARALRAQSPC